MQCSGDPMPYLDHFLGKRNERLRRGKRGSTRPLRGDKRRHVIDEVMNILKDWRSSEFEHEADCRYGLRAALCREGFGWHTSDIDADLIVQQALSLIGAERPSWTEGQPDYAAARDNCLWCGKGMPDAMTAGGRAQRFCSRVCAQSALLKQGEESSFRKTVTGIAAYRLVRRERQPLRPCLQCGEQFRPFNYQTRGQRFCSTACAGAHARRIPERECKTCGTGFRPRQSGGIYCSIGCSTNRPAEPKPCRSCGGFVNRGSRQAPFCSNACRNKEGRALRAISRQSRECKRSCRQCGESFVSKSGLAAYCSNTCSSLAAYYRKKHAVQPSNVIYLTAEIFDGWFRRAA